MKSKNTLHELNPQSFKILIVTLPIYPTFLLNEVSTKIINIYSKRDLNKKILLADSVQPLLLNHLFLGQYQSSEIAHAGGGEDATGVDADHVGATDSSARGVWPKITVFSQSVSDALI